MYRTRKLSMTISCGSFENVYIYIEILYVGTYVFNNY